MLAFLYCLNFQKKLDKELSYFSFYSRYHDKFALKQIKLLPVSNLFPLEVVQKCQRYKLCVFEHEKAKSGRELRITFLIILPKQ